MLSRLQAMRLRWWCHNPTGQWGRAALLTAPAVKTAALAMGLRVAQPEKIKNNLELRADLGAIAPDAILIVAYGRIVPRWMLDLPRYGNINLHGSLLPKYRGAAPIQWAIARGETMTGVTTMRIDEGLDTGQMLLQRELPIGPDDTSVDLFPRLAGTGAALMVETLAGLDAAALVAQPQDHSAATLAPILTREDAQQDFTQTANVLYDRWRGFSALAGRVHIAARQKADAAQDCACAWCWRTRRRCVRRAWAMLCGLWRKHAIGIA